MRHDHVLALSCPDRTGIVYRVTGLLFDPVITNSAHVPRDAMGRAQHEINRATTIWVQAKNQENQSVRDLAQELDRWVFVGDSGNDQAMFQHFTHSVGVANLLRFADQLQHWPAWLTVAERGQGFAEVAQALLAARRA